MDHILVSYEIDIITNYTCEIKADQERLDQADVISGMTDKTANNPLISFVYINHANYTSFYAPKRILYFINVAFCRLLTFISMAK